MKSFFPPLLANAALLILFSNLPAHAAPPVNDDFANATLLSGSGPLAVTGWTFDATAEANEPDRGPKYIKRLGSHSIWWRWTAPASQLVTIDTYDSTSDTTLHVYTGASLELLSLVRASDDARANLDSRVTFVAQAGSTYHIRVSSVSQSAQDDVSLHLVTTPSPATAAAHLAYGRSYLEGRTSADLDAADAHFQQALALAPTDQVSHALRAVTRLARLQSAPAFATLLAQWGIQTKRAGLHRAEFDTTKDAAGVRSAPAGADAAQATAYLNSEVLPELGASENHLQQISATNFTLMMTDSETGSRWMDVDSGDVQILRALGYAGQAAIRMNNTLDTDGSIGALLDLENQRKLKAEHIVKLLPNFLKRRSGSDQRAAFKTAAQQASARFQAGSSFIRARVDTPDNRHHLFHIGAKRTRKEQELRENAVGLSQALDGPAVWAGVSVNLTPLLTTATPYRDLLPRLKDRRAIGSTAPDPTLQNALPGGTQGQANRILEDNDLAFFIATFSEWAQIFLGNQSVANQQPGADLEADGFNNYAEYVFGLDPLNASSADEFSNQGLVAGPVPSASYFAISFIRRTAPATATYSVWVSDDLTTWDTTEAQIEPAGPPVTQADDSFELVTYRLKLPVDSAPRKFLKVVVSE